MARLWRTELKKGILQKATLLLLVLCLLTNGWFVYETARTPLNEEGFSTYTRTDLADFFAGHVDENAAEMLADLSVTNQMTLHLNEYLTGITQ